jgi:hypothetical protein
VRVRPQPTRPVRAPVAHRPTAGSGQNCPRPVCLDPWSDELAPEHRDGPAAEQDPVAVGSDPDQAAAPGRLVAGQVGAAKALGPERSEGAVGRPGDRSSSIPAAGRSTARRSRSRPAPAPARRRPRRRPRSRSPRGSRGRPGSGPRGPAPARPPRRPARPGSRTGPARRTGAGPHPGPPGDRAADRRPRPGSPGSRARWPCPRPAARSARRWRCRTGSPAPRRPAPRSRAHGPRPGWRARTARPPPWG